MYKKHVDFHEKLQSEKAQLAAEITGLKRVAEQPDPPPFDELEAASRVTQAKTKDHMEGTQLADEVIKAINGQRKNAVNDRVAMLAARYEAQQQLALKNAQILSVDNEIRALGHKINMMVMEEAQALANAKKEEYRQLATQLLNCLIDMDVLDAIAAGQSKNHPANLVFMLASLPAIGLKGVHPWVEDGMGRLFIAKNHAPGAVHERYLKTIDEIKGDMYARQPT